MTNYRYTKTIHESYDLTVIPYKKILTPIKGDSSKIRDTFCYSLTEGFGFNENGWTLLETQLDNNGNPKRTYGKMLYNTKIIPQVKPPIKSLFGHKSEDSINFGEIYI